jgi:hypothetical protein
MLELGVMREIIPAAQIMQIQFTRIATRRSVGGFTRPNSKGSCSLESTGAKQSLALEVTMVTLIYNT